MDALTRWLHGIDHDTKLVAFMAALLFVLACEFLLLVILWRKVTKLKRPPETPKSDVVEAKRLVLRDGSGKVRADLAMATDGPALVLRDANDKARVRVALGVDGARVGLFDEQARPRALLAAQPDGPRVTLWDVEGKPLFSKP